MTRCFLKLRLLAPLVLIGLFALVVLAPGLAGAQDHPLPTHVVTITDNLIEASKRLAAPDFSLPDSDGQTLQLSALRGKVVLVDFWATWCGGCKFELPYFVDFDRKYRSAGLSSVGVSMDDGGMQVVRSFLQAKQIPYPSVLGNDAVTTAFHLGAMPMTVLIDRKGRIALSHSGVVDRANFEEHVRTLLAEGK
jgi:peroxiredoxin